MADTARVRLAETAWQRLQQEAFLVETDALAATAGAQLAAERPAGRHEPAELGRTVGSVVRAWVGSGRLEGAGSGSSTEAVIAVSWASGAVSAALEAGVELGWVQAWARSGPLPPGLVEPADLRPWRLLGADAALWWAAGWDPVRAAEAVRRGPGNGCPSRQDLEVMAGLAARR